MKILLPSNNLGCFGIKISQRIYFDFFRTPYVGMFIRLFSHKFWINFKELRISHGS